MLPDGACRVERAALMVCTDLAGRSGRVRSPASLFAHATNSTFPFGVDGPVSVGWAAVAHTAVTLFDSRSIDRHRPPSAHKLTNSPLAVLASATARAYG